MHLPVGFQPPIPASGWVQTHTLDCVATAICYCIKYIKLYIVNGKNYIVCSKGSPGAHHLYEGPYEGRQAGREEGL